MSDDQLEGFTHPRAPSLKGGGVKRRFAFKLLVFLLLGAIINVAVAWYVSIPSRDTHYPVSFNARWPIVVPSHWPAQCKLSRYHRLGHFYETGSNVVPSGNFLASREESGFPAKWLNSAEWIEFDNAATVVEQLKTPMQVAWPGFAINTIFYAAIVWMLFAVPGYIKRRRRSKRGQCVRCAYPLGTSSVCSECGTPADSRKPIADSPSP